MTSDKLQLAALNKRLMALDISDRLRWIGQMSARAVLTTSLGPEDQVLTHHVARSGADVAHVTLQTGRLFSETLDLLDTTRARYGVAIDEFHPDPSSVADYVSRYGANGFYDSVQARHACCAIRKVAPLGRALMGADGWVTGMRRSQSANRQDVALAEWSPERGLLKFNPLADWSSDDLKAEIEANDIPVNALHARGYVSIGCDPCTRAIKPGEHERAGRWWWEQDQSRECGLHVASEPSAAANDGRGQDGTQGWSRAL